MSGRFGRWGLVAVLWGVLVACSGVKDDPLLKLSASEALAEGQRLLELKKYGEARKYLIHAFEVEPNSVDGREGLLLAADALFLAGGEDNFTEAETRYRDFLNRFPTSERAAYAQLRIAQSLARRMAKADRDQATTRKALQEFENVARLYPTSAEAEEANAEVSSVKRRLADHERKVGAFYVRYGCRGERATVMCNAAASRFEEALKVDPDYQPKASILEPLCLVYAKFEALPDGATDACAELGRTPRPRKQKQRPAETGEGKKPPRGGENAPDPR